MVIAINVIHMNFVMAFRISRNTTNLKTSPAFHILFLISRLVTACGVSVCNTQWSRIGDKSQNDHATLNIETSVTSRVIHAKRGSLDPPLEGEGWQGSDWVGCVGQEALGFKHVQKACCLKSLDRNLGGSRDPIFHQLGDFKVMKFSMKQFFVASAMVAVSTAAFADANDAVVPAVITDVLQAGPTNNGSLSLYIESKGAATWNVSSNLGLFLNDVVPTKMDGSDGQGLSLTWHLDGLNALVAGSGVAASDLVWGVNATDTQAFSTAPAGSIRVATTVGTGITTVNNSQLNSTANSISNVVIANNATAGNPDVNTTAQAGNDTRDKLSTSYGIVGFSWTGALSDTLAMYLYSNTGNQLSGSSNAASGTQYAGLWTLNLANDTLSYSVAPTSTVPVPAALWLLLSGLSGLGVIGRRGSKAA